MTVPTQKPIVSLIVAVPDTPSAVEWYKENLGAHLLWSLDPVDGLEIEGVSFFLHESVKNTFSGPTEIGTKQP